MRPQQLLQRQPPEMSSPHEDTEVVAAMLRGDRKATAAFVSRCADEVYSYVRSRLAPRYDQVDDLVQEVFLAGWQSLTRYRGEGALLGWIMGIARHKVEDYYRRCLRVNESLDEEAAPALEGLARLPDVEDGIDRDKLRQKMQRVLRQLPEPYRLALVWRYWERASAREMALKTGKTEKAIERLLARARGEFRQRWNRDEAA
jgi:RNA polymerase sigma-70 factor, ECF subfamily